MKLTKKRLQKIINSISQPLSTNAEVNINNKQTRKKLKRNIKKLNHTNTVRNNRQFNLRNKTLKSYDV